MEAKYEYLADIKLKCADSDIMVERSVLAKSSEKFNNMFKSGMIEARKMEIDFTQFSKKIVISCYKFVASEPSDEKTRVTNFLTEKVTLQLIDRCTEMLNFFHLNEMHEGTKFIISVFSRCAPINHLVEMNYKFGLGTKEFPDTLGMETEFAEIFFKIFKIDNPSFFYVYSVPAFYKQLIKSCGKDYKIRFPMVLESYMKSDHNNPLEVFGTMDIPDLAALRLSYKFKDPYKAADFLRNFCQKRINEVASTAAIFAEKDTVTEEDLIKYIEEKTLHERDAEEEGKLFEQFTQNKKRKIDLTVE